MKLSSTGVKIELYVLLSLLALKEHSAKNTSTYSLLDLFCFDASLSIFSNTRLERAMLTGCLCTIFGPLIICCFVNI